MADYQIFTDATADLSPEMLSGLSPVEMPSASPGLFLSM